ncbi:hypothetical protein [Pedosphaera parvula]|uniref:Uncharacterized protein n=1 Tax=Pedosphaera parvula (strain Ellin514) TaxID=320771 RepID=B9XDE4_PEDPL|nr:hypothetical protein [Pedosphaera parvula]EEF62090.1 hypothetical protein Cflav_PD6365 [Pedosphaera parvula Ellin514]
MRTERRFQLGAAEEASSSRADRALKAYVENHRRVKMAMIDCFAGYMLVFRAIKASVTDPQAIRKATKILAARRGAFKQALAVYLASYVAWNEALKTSAKN